MASDIRRQITLDRGEPIKPEVVGPLVYRRRAQNFPGLPGEFEEYHVVVHPIVFEDAFMRVHDLPYWSEHHPLGDAAILPTLRCCGLLVDSDPMLRYDEVRLRREETLT